MAEVGSAFVTIAPSAKGFGSKLTQEVGAEADRSGKSVGRRFGTALKVGALAVAGAAAGGALFLKGAVDAASDLAESQSKVGVVFGKSAGQIMKASQTSATAMGLSKQAYLEATGTLGNLLTSLGATPKVAATQSKSLVKLAGDLASFNNVSPEEALDALKSGLTGETEPLKKFGVNMNDATLKAQALKMGLVKNTKEALTPQNKALAAQSLIFAQTRTAQGDFARTSGGLANQQRILSAQFANSKASLGKIFLPLAVKAITLMNKGFSTIGPIVDRVKTSFANFTNGPGLSGLVSTLQARLMPVLRTMATTFMTVIVPALQRFAAFVVANVLPILQRMATIFLTQVVPILAKVAQFIYGQLVPALVKLVTQIAGSLRPVFEELFAQIQSTVLPVIAKLLAKFREWWPTIQRVIQITLAVIGVVLRLAAAILGKVLPPLIQFAGFLIRVVVGAVLAVIGVIVKIIAKLIDFGKWCIDAGRKIGEFAGKVKDGVAKAVGFIKELPDKAKNALGDLKDVLLQKGKDLIQGLIDGIGKKIGEAVQKVRDGLQKIKDMLPGSPIKSGPLKPWNNTGRSGPGGRLMGLLGEGISNSTAVDQAMGRLSARLAIQGPKLAIADGGDALARSSSAGRAAPSYNFYTFDLNGAVRDAQRREAFTGGA